MNFKPLSLLAAVLLLAACAQNPETNATSGGSAVGAGGGTGTETSGVRAGSREDFVQNAGDRVFFDFNSSDIGGEGRAVLQRQAEWLKRYPNVTVTVAGNCDPRGTREYNLALGARRASAAKNALVALGVQASRIQTISYGKERPAVAGDGEQAWAQDRNAITQIN